MKNPDITFTGRVTHPALIIGPGQLEVVGNGKALCTIHPEEWAPLLADLQEAQEQLRPTGTPEAQQAIRRAREIISAMNAVYGPTTS